MGDVDSIRIDFPGEVWIAGKGPGLDIFDWGAAGGKFVIGINQAAYVVPGVCCAAAMDHVMLRDYEKRLKKSVLVVCPIRKAGYRFLFCLRYDERMYGVGGHGTLPVVLNFFSYFGVKKFNLVGCDSMRGSVADEPYAKCLGIPQVMSEFARASLLRISDQARRVALERGLKLNII